MKRSLPITLLQIAFGALIFSAGVGLFLDPNRLAPGGVTGIAVILSKFTGIPTGTWALMINLPLLAFGLWRFGWIFMGKTIYSVILTSLFTNWFCAMEPVTEDPVLAALSGAVLMGTGVGLIFRTGATTGGIDIPIKALRQKFRHLKTGRFFQIFDITIVSVSGLVFRDTEIALYALFACLLSGFVVNRVLYGSDEARLIYIITDRADAIRDRLIQQVDVGCTLMDAKGGYSGQDKQVILCTVHNRMAPQVQQAVRAEDPGAFMILGVAEEVYGLGYKDYFSDSM